MFTEVNGKPVCQVCMRQVSVLKEYNIRRHYETQHGEKYNSLHGELRKQKVNEMLVGLRKQQSVFNRSREVSDAAVKASYVIASQVALASKPYSEGEFVKNCMLKDAEIVCPEKRQAFANISLTRNTVADRISEQSADLDSQLKCKVESFLAFSVAIDESTDITDVAQLAIFIRGVDDTLTVTEEFLELVPMTDTTTAEDIFRSVVGALDRVGADWSRAVSVATDGAPSMIGKKAVRELKVKITLIADSTTIPAGGSVTLTCDQKEPADLLYQWFRETSPGNKITLDDQFTRVISISKGGIYTCRGWRRDPDLITTESDPVTILKTVLAVGNLQHSWSQIFTGETITLRCEIEGGEGKVWKYEWTAPNTNSPPTSSEYRISTVSVSHSGDYRCQGSSDYLLTGWSDAFTLTVSSSKPRATLRPRSSIIPAGGSVTLSCSVEGSAGWKFDWFRRDSVSSKAQLMRGNEANRVISVSQGGLYHCRGGRGDPVYYTEDSSDVTVKETLAPSGPKRFPAWLVVGLVCGVSLLIILLLLMCRYRKLKDLCFTGPIQSDINSQDSTRNHGVNQNEIQGEYKSLHPGEYELYETVHHSEDTANGANGDHHIYETIQDLEDIANVEDESPEATYSLIEVKDFGMERKHHKPHKSTFYTDVNTGTAGQ
ncbi:unnamed protein product [Oreochromis niloticus]|nr:unnamed protein product [Mustela putorius furo]